MKCKGKLAYLGPPTTNSHVAALLMFESLQSRQLVSKKKFTEIFRAVSGHRSTTTGVIPYENVMSEGLVQQVPRLLLSHEVHVIGAKNIPVRHFLLGKKCLPFAAVETILSKQEVFEQCRDWLERHLPEAEQVPTSSTATAAEQAASDPSCAAIATHLAAKAYGLQVLAEDIQGAESDNWTRFLAIAPAPIECELEEARTLIAWKLRHVAGALHYALEPFARQGISMERIRSLTLDGDGTPTFFCEAHGHQNERHMGFALRDMEELVISLKVLGSYHEL